MYNMTPTSWHNFPAISLNSSRLSVVILPELGGKIASLYDRLHQREWLVPPVRPLRPIAYAAEFINQDMSGWDEMLPTIDRCTWEAVQLPDHGEVWSLPWEVEQSGEALVLSVHGRALPYRFIRSLQFVSEDSLELRYWLENHGSAPFPYLWAAHPQFLAYPQTRLLLPPEVNRVINIIEDDPLWGAAGTKVTWPVARDSSGREWAVDRVGPVERRACRKFYLSPDEPVSWVALRDENTGCQLRLGWDPQEIPYLGLWVDEGMFSVSPVAALEPSNAYYDSLERAVNLGSAPFLEPDSQVEWTLHLQASG